ncbi:MAG: SGNH/GDSL hydrolase family protein, partial [Parabacteroides sp.]|nr:SGNH/GDSL hydrolase family protein [Parabacteroides sp.]
MKKIVLIGFLIVFAVSSLLAQSAKSVSILGDSYSTFQGYMQPDTNVVWY